VLIVLKSGSLNLLEPSGLVQACNGIAFKLGCQKVNVNFDILKQIGCALVGQIKDWKKMVG
jgi:hypothetical protein